MTGKTHVAAGLLVGAITVDHYHTDLFSTVTVICLAIAEVYFQIFVIQEVRLEDNLKFLVCSLVLSLGIEHLRIHCYS